MVVFSRTLLCTSVIGSYASCAGATAQLLEHMEQRSHEEVLNTSVHSHMELTFLPAAHTNTHEQSRSVAVKPGLQDISELFWDTLPYLQSH